MKNTPFFIIGSERGDTTLLRLMLNKNSKLGIPPESHFISTLISRFKDYTKTLSQQELFRAKEIILTHPGCKSWKISEEDLDNLVTSLSKQIDLSCFLKTFDKKSYIMIYEQ